MMVVGLYCALNFRIKFAGYQTETQYKTEFKIRGCAQSGGQFILFLWLPIFELSRRLQNLYSLLKTLKYTVI